MTEADKPRQDENGLVEHSAFPALVALWFAGLLGAGMFILPAPLFDIVFGGQSPLGDNTRFVAAIVAAGLGLLLGLFIATRIRSGGPTAVTGLPRPRRKKKKGGRPPLDVNAAFSMDDDDERTPTITRHRFDEDEPHPDAERETDNAETDDIESDDDMFTADLAVPIDDPHFASAWSDAERTGPASRADWLRDIAALRRSVAHDEDEWNDEPAETAPAIGETAADAADRAGPDDFDWDGAQDPLLPSPDADAVTPRYNPFANLARPEEDDPSEVELASSPVADARREEPDTSGPELRTIEATEFVKPDPPAAPVVSTVRPANQRPAPAPNGRAAPPPPPAWPEARTADPALRDLGVAELVERLARALQQRPDDKIAAPPTPPDIAPAPRVPSQAPFQADAQRERTTPDTGEIDRALRSALDRLARLDDVA